MDPGALCRLFAILCCEVGLLEDTITLASRLYDGVRHDRGPALAHHQGQVRELIFDLAIREADASDELVGNVDEGADLHVDTLALLMVLVLWLLHLVLVAADKERGHVVRVGEFVRAVGLHLLTHFLEVIDHLLRFASLFEACDEELRQFALEAGVALAVDAQEDRRSIVFNDWLDLLLLSSCSATSRRVDDLAHLTVALSH